jgi:hypothetical protein
MVILLASGLWLSRGHLGPVIVAAATWVCLPGSSALAEVPPAARLKSEAEKSASENAGARKMLLKLMMTL